MSAPELYQFLRPWYLSRASGLVALLTLWLSVILGLLQSTRLLRGLTSPVANIDLHDFTAVLGLHMSLLHGLILVFDSYVPFTVAGVLVPFVSAYRPGETALGIIALYLTAAAITSTYLRHQLSPFAWRAIHLFSLVGFLAAQMHGWLLGTDSALEPVFYLYSFTGVSVTVLVAYRVWLALR